MQEKKYEEILAKHVAQCMEMLKQEGITKLQLQFCYNAPTREAADEFACSLRAKTEYEVSVEKLLFRRKWRVEGCTHEAIPSEILDQWVTSMVATGKEHFCNLVSISFNFNTFSESVLRELAILKQPGKKSKIAKNHQVANSSASTC